MLSPLEGVLIALLLVVLMFGMGATLTLASFRDVLAHPKAVLVGLAAQFGFMPLVAYLLSRWLELEPAAALGLVITGACPGGTTGNMFAYQARADVALSVSMTAATKLVGVALMPLCLFLYARPLSGTNVVVPYADSVKMLLFLLLPVAFGMWLRRARGADVARAAERIGSGVGLLVIVLVVSISLVRNAHLLTTLSSTQCAASGLLGVCGMLFGFFIARASGLNAAQQRAVCLGTGIQNCPLAFAMITMSFHGEPQTEMLKVPMLYALFVLFQASSVTLYFRRAV